MADRNPPNQSTVKSAMRTIDILEYVVASSGGAVALDIAAALSIPISSLSYLLGTLVERDYLRREGRRYYPGPGLERLRTGPHSMTLADRVRPLVRTLRIQLNETASFFVQSDWELVALVTETAEQTLRYSISVGSKTPLFCVAAGKALLAELGEEELDRYFAETELTPFTPNSILDEKRLRRELDKIRKAGYAVTNEEYTLGICGVGKAVIVDGRPVGAFGIAVPNPRFDERMERHASDLLSKTAALLEAGEG
ncbi:MAG: IclR family transcriptional regulator [Sphingobium sp.]